jgi:hypothetical protein
MTSPNRRRQGPASKEPASFGQLLPCIDLDLLSHLGLKGEHSSLTGDRSGRLRTNLKRHGSLTGGSGRSPLTGYPAIGAGKWPWSLRQAPDMPWPRSPLEARGHDPGGRQRARTLAGRTTFSPS